MTTSKNHENMKRKVMAKGYCQPKKKKKAMATSTNEEKNTKKG
jgi:hypothetical protein